jgi:hypothetical protein
MHSTEAPVKIASSSLQMASSHASVERHEVRESLKMWVGPQRPQFAGEESRPRPIRGCVSFAPCSNC